MMEREVAFGCFVEDIKGSSRSVSSKEGQQQKKQRKWKKGRKQVGRRILWREYHRGRGNSEARPWLISSYPGRNDGCKSGGANLMEGKECR